MRNLIPTPPDNLPTDCAALPCAKCAGVKFHRPIFFDELGPEPFIVWYCKVCGTNRDPIAQNPLPQNVIDKLLKYGAEMVERERGNIYIIGGPTITIPKAKA